MTTLQQTRRQIAIALAIIIGILGFVLIVRSAIPAHGQTTTLQPRAWLMAQRDYAAPVASSCEAPGPCETTSR